ncbi:hypothetical protein [Nocardia bovistercoris]|uniref:Uncharacterized protein n=1 Tax=Nocardia bovistercoris TaxID=2785916 RepID=A0A931I5R1_9NOCA|nr:hypothetical protein [Nocardia bovistercoris]MBH0774701.1 hypothetical protein [Nocardia bovistercoris]
MEWAIVGAARRTAVIAGMGALWIRCYRDSFDWEGRRAPQPVIPGRGPSTRRRAGVGSIIGDRKRVQRRCSPAISEIGFDYRPGPPGRADVRQIMPRIDTISLNDLIDTFEISADMQPAGDAYGGLVPRFVRFESAVDHFHGFSSLAMGQKIPVLACSCGELGCWPLLTRISLTGDLVVWDYFEQPYRTARDYTAFGPFLFDRDQYDKAVRVLGAAIAAHE